MPRTAKASVGGVCPPGEVCCDTASSTPSPTAPLTLGERGLKLARILIQTVERSADKQDIVGTHLEIGVEFDKHGLVPLHRHYRRTGPLPHPGAPRMLTRQSTGRNPDKRVLMQLAWRPSRVDFTVATASSFLRVSLTAP